MSGVNMTFAYDTEWALMAAAALVNTARCGRELLPDEASLDRFLDEHRDTGRREGSAVELADVRALRERLRQTWSGDLDVVVALSNGLLADAKALPWLTDHDGFPWHLHLTSPDAPLVDRMAAEYAMAFADLIRLGDLDRLGRCSAPDCDAVLVDLTRNRSRKFCDTGNCGNRQHVAAYRTRQERPNS
jgi:predicted RNA-binding Zn ribbon-like protein